MPVLFVFNLQTKFEMSGFSRSKDMAWAPKCRNGTPDPDHAHLGIVRHHKTNTSHGQLILPTAFHWQSSEATSLSWVMRKCCHHRCRHWTACCITEFIMPAGIALPLPPRNIPVSASASVGLGWLASGINPIHARLRGSSIQCTDSKL